MRQRWWGFVMQWRQLDHMQTVCTSLQTDNHNNTSSLNFYRPDAFSDTQPTVSEHWKVTFIMAVNSVKFVIISFFAVYSHFYRDYYHEFWVFAIRWRNLHVGECRWNEGLLSRHMAVWVLSSCLGFAESCWGQPIAAGAIAAMFVIGQPVHQSQLEPLQQRPWLVAFCTSHSWSPCSSVCDWSPCVPMASIKCIHLCCVCMFLIVASVTVCQY